MKNVLLLQMLSERANDPLMVEDRDVVAISAVSLQGMTGCH